MRIKKGFLLSSMILLALAYLGYNNFDFNFLTRFVTSPFAAGKSNPKHLIFFIYAALCFFLLALNIKTKINIKPRKLFTILIIALLLPFIGHIMFYLGSNIPSDAFFDRAVVVKSTPEYLTMSSNSLFHIHIMKSLIAYSYSFLNNEHINNMDMGTTFLGLIPKEILFIQLILVVILLIWFLIILINLKKIVPKRKYVSFLILYIITSFALLKNTVEGGFLSVSTLPSIVFMWYILTIKDEKLFIEKVTKACLILVFPYIILSILFNDSFLFFFNLLLAFIVLLHLIYYLMASFEKKQGERARRNNVILTAFLIFLFILLVPLNPVVKEYNNQNTIIEKYLSIYVTDYLDLSEPIKNNVDNNLIGREGKITLYNIKMDQPKEIKYFTKQFGFNPFYHTIKIKGRECMTQKDYEVSFAIIKLISEEKYTFKDSPFFNVTEIKCNPEKCDYLIQFKINACYPTVGGLLFYNHIVENGLTWFIAFPAKTIDI